MKGYSFEFYGHKCFYEASSKKEAIKMFLDECVNIIEER